MDDHTKEPDRSKPFDGAACPDCSTPYNCRLHGCYELESQQRGQYGWRTTNGNVLTTGAASKPSPRLHLGDPLTWIPIHPGLAVRHWPIGSSADDPLDRSWTIAFRGTDHLTEGQVRMLEQSFASTLHTLAAVNGFPAQARYIRDDAGEQRRTDQARQFGEALHKVRVGQGETARRLEREKQARMFMATDPASDYGFLYTQEGGVTTILEEFGLPSVEERQRQAQKLLVQSLTQDEVLLRGLIKRALNEKAPPIPLQGKHHLGCQEIAAWEVTDAYHPLEPTYACDQHLAAMCSSLSPEAAKQAYYVVTPQLVGKDQQRCCYISETKQ